jgi:hypothetical protein
MPEILDGTWSNLPTTREEARSLGTVNYFTGKPCQNGHVERRYTNTGICYACKRQNIKKDNVRYPERALASGRRSYRNNREARLANSYRWTAANKEKSREIKRKNKEKHREKYKESARIRMREKRRNDPMFRLNRNMSKAVWEWLRDRKGFRSWLTLVNYTIEELKAHLEAQFVEEMAWDNYGTVWELDHIKPLSKCASFNEAWTLTNLRPLTIFANRSKGSKHTEMTEEQEATRSYLIDG